MKSWVQRLSSWRPDLEERKRIYQSFSKIFKAIQEKDVDKAQELMEKYIKKSMRNYES
jgi:DNA-binding FadR family transcriptional regulator